MDIICIFISLADPLFNSKQKKKKKKGKKEGLNIFKKRWQEYIEELYKKDLHGPDNHDGVIIHLEPDILECDVK